jgi:hypothetical protein
VSHVTPASSVAAIREVLSLDEVLSLVKPHTSQVRNVDTTTTSPGEVLTNIYSTFAVGSCSSTGLDLRIGFSALGEFS